MNLDQFVAAYTGKRVRSAHGLGGQCVDLTEQYLADVLGDPPLAGNAIDEFGEESNHFTWIRNNPADIHQLPARGDVMVWGPSKAIGTGVYGHTAIVLEADVSGFTSFDQNWPVGAVAHQVRHNYVGIIGWGLPRAAAASSPFPAPPTPPQRVPAPPPTAAPANPPLVSPPPLQGGVPVAVNPPTAPVAAPTPVAAPPAATPAPVPDVPEPAPVAEAGVTTSEWKVLVGFAVQEAAAGTGLVIAKLGGHVDAATLQVVAGAEVGLLVIAASWIIGRSIRKLGTTA